MFILHVALQGCLRGSNVEYGITADTGGHIRYLLDLAHASAAQPEIRRQVIATRAFVSQWGDDYARPWEPLSRDLAILRLSTTRKDYLPKEELWREVPAFADALVDWIAGQEVWPDLLHAHYADAGAVAARVRERLGIPYVFTAHSLGRVKRRVLLAARGAEAGEAAKADDNLERRIAAEEEAIGRASLIIASSRDEAESQYASYAAYDPGRLRVIAPGSDLSLFSDPAASPKIDAAINRFLHDPNKPPLLALARPVSKKNLPALVRAYGECPRLQQRANLVLFAGSREDIEGMEPELEENLREVLRLIDRYDLYGRVAYPKHHDPADVPAIYAYARQRRGLFVNPALNEPFGLTLLEAAAAGLPVVATDNGGPVDILEVCRNGVLVNPQQPHAIAQAALAMLKDGKLWARYAEAGIHGVRNFDWDRHARDYCRLLTRLQSAQVPVGPSPTSQATSLLVTDIDSTLVGCRSAARTFRNWRAEQGGMLHAVATGRSFHSALAVLEREELPLPQAMITSVGSEIYWLNEDGVTYAADEDWRACLAADWPREEILAALAGHPELQLQAPLEQRRYKLSFLVDKAEGLQEILAAELARQGLACTLIVSHGRYLDILPAGASKGGAVNYIAGKLGLADGDVVVAGDSGNDVEMLQSAAQSIIVANYRDDLADHRELEHCYLASSGFACGVMEGVSHFRGEAAPQGCDACDRAVSAE